MSRKALDYNDFQRQIRGWSGKIRPMKKIVILISGRGSNMEAIVRACQSEKWPAEVAAVIANRPDAGGLAYAADQGIATALVDHTQFPDRASFDAALAACIDGFAPDVVVLAGFMRILTDGFVQHYAGRLLNVHPSLLPSFPGTRTHQRALAEGVKVHGATVHFVTPELDHGPIVLQAALPVLPEDDEASLAQRLLVQEHLIYPQAVRWFVEGRLHVQNGVVRVTPPASQLVFVP